MLRVTSPMEETRTFPVFTSCGEVRTKRCRPRPELITIGMLEVTDNKEEGIYDQGQFVLSTVQAVMLTDAT